MEIGLMFLLFVVVLFLGTPVAYTLGIVSLLFIIADNYPIFLLAQRMFVGIDSFPLMALPLFLLAGNLMNTGGITDRLWRFARALVGFVPGGMGQVSVLSSMLFASMSGSALAAAGGLGPMQIKGMVEDGFRKDFAAAIAAAASTMGPIIPPSIVFVLYGVLGGVSVGKLFLAGIIPGVLMGLSLMVYILVVAIRNRNQYVVSSVPRAGEVLKAFGNAFFPLMLPVIILAGILGGIFTPTEAAAIACAYSLLLGIIYKQLNSTSLLQVLRDTVRISASIMLIIGFAATFSWLLTAMGASRSFTSFVAGAGLSKFEILILLNIGLLIVGLFVETNSAVVLLTPLLVPTMVAVGIDPVHLGIIICINLLIGILTPPMGMALYVVSRAANVPFQLLVRQVIPLVVILLLVQIAVTFVPSLSLFLPNLIMR